MNKQTLKQTAAISAISLMIGHAGFAYAQEPVETVPSTTDETATLDTVVVTGSFLQKDQSDLVSPVTFVNREDIDKTGIITPQELFRWEPANSGSTNQSHISGQTDTAGTSNINLRGIGIGATLVLLNGRRVAEAPAVTNENESFVDISNLMPSIMLEQVEILKDGAAATYGSDAIAGVVNFKTRDDFEGFELRYDGQWTTRSDDHRDQEVAAIWGGGSDATHVVAALSYFDRTPIRALDRPDNREFPKTTSGFGSPGTFTFLDDATTGTFAGIDAGSRIPDPNCTLGTDSFIAGGSGPFNEGGTCRFDFGQGLNLIAEERRIQAFILAEHELSDQHRVFAEFGYTDHDITTRTPPALPVLTAPSPVISASHPGNPFGVDVAATFRPFGTGTGPSGTGSVERPIDLNSIRFVGGVEGALPLDTWTYNLAFTYSENTYNTEQQDTSTSKLDLAFAGFGGVNCDVLNGTAGVGDCLFFNPFGTSLTANPGDAAFNTQEVIDFITEPNPEKRITELVSFDAIVTGDVVQLPAGPLQLALGYQYREDTRTTERSQAANQLDLIFFGGGPDFSGTREVNALFGEASVPVFESDGHSFDLSLALRYEDYDIGFNSTDYKIGGLYRFNDLVSARASYSTAFRAPTNFLLFGENTLPRALTDPFTGIRNTVGQTSAPSPDLQPEEAESYNFGVTVNPTSSLQLSLDYYNIEVTDRFAVEGQQAIVNADAASLTAAGCTVATLATPTCLAAAQPNVVRDLNTGDISRLFLQRLNAPAVETDGLDFAFNYGIETEFGDFDLTNASTYVLNFKAQTAPGADFVQFAGNRNFGTTLGRSVPRLRSNTGLSWSDGNHSAAFTFRYVSGYEESNGHEIDPWVVGDLQYKYDFSLFDEHNMSVTVGAINITDENPPITETGNDYGYDPTVSDPRGRMIYTSLKYAF